jgi:hypothetical protein
MTKKIRKAAEALGISIHDHLVIGRKGHASFRSLGLLSQAGRDADHVNGGASRRPRQAARRPAGS